MDVIEDQVFTARPDDNQELIRKIDKARKDITFLLRLLGDKPDVLRAFIKHYQDDRNIGTQMDIGLYLGDILDHVITMMHNLIHIEKVISRSYSNYLAHLSIVQMDQGNKANKLLSRVTVIGTICMALFVVCAVFGMNVRVPWKQGSNIFAFLGIAGTVVLFGLLCFVFARRAKLL